jgi:phosphoribosylformylglycinamidine cyclo-ligase
MTNEGVLVEDTRVAITYDQAGVDTKAGDELVERIKPLAAMTHRPELLSGVGGFGGLFTIPSGYREPVLVSGTDGVGTKLKVAFAANRHESVGIDLVAMSVNDVLTTGAEPLFFLDYFATSRLDIAQAEKVIAGVARGCAEAGCTLLGGETAELPGFYVQGEYDLAGFCVGVVERRRIIDGREIRPGDALIGLASSGLHSNGFSLVRKVLLEKGGLSLSSMPTKLGRPLVDELLEPTRIYVKSVRSLMTDIELKGLAHITGGGIPGNLPRCLPPETCAVLSESSWKRPPIFDLVSEYGVERDEMFSTFNMGLGMIAVVSRQNTAAVLQKLREQQVTAWEVGQIEKGEGEPWATIQQ